MTKINTGTTNSPNQIESFTLELNALSREIDAALRSHAPHLSAVRGVALASAMALGMGLAPVPALAATFTVDNTTDGNDPSCADGDCSLREAIEAANASPGADTVDASSVTGTITLTNGEIAITDDVTITGPGSAQLTVDANNASRHFYIDGSDTAISGLTLTNGDSSQGGAVYVYGDDAALSVTDSTFSNNQAATDGGAIYIYNEVGTLSLSIDNSTFTDNVAGAGDGGAIFGLGFGGGGVTITGSDLTNNGASNSGGAVYLVGGDLTLMDTTISGNYAGDDDGGGFYMVEGNASLTNTTVSGNTAYSNGGGFWVSDGGVILTNSIVSGNMAENGTGGGFYVVGDVSLDYSTVSDNYARVDGGGFSIVGNATLIYSTVSDNYAYVFGGGFYVINGDAALTKSTVSRNSTGGFGGGFAVAGATTVMNSTVSGNTADSNGGGFSAYGNVTLENSTVSNNDSGGYGGGFNVSDDATLANSIVANNTAPTGAEFNVFGSLTAAYSLVEGDSDPPVSGGTNGNITGQDPQLGPLQDNGGSTLTHAIDSSSPAFNAGDPNFTPPPDTDQRGSGFARLAQGRLDMGAYEAQTQGGAPVTVVSLSLSTSSVQEGNPSADSTLITATLNQSSSSDVTVTVGFSGQAQFGADFSVSGNPIVIPAGDVSGSAQLTALDDIQVEGNEPFTATVQSATGADVPDPPPQAEGVIIDDDQTLAAPVVPIPALSPLGLLLLPLLIPVAAWRYLRRSVR